MCTQVVKFHSVGVHAGDHPPVSPAKQKGEHFNVQGSGSPVEIRRIHFDAICQRSGAAWGNWGVSAMVIGSNDRSAGPNFPDILV